VVAVAKLQVSNQLHNVNVFVDRMGPIAVIIETADKEAKAGKLKKEAFDANEANKKKVVAAIRNLHDGLVALETDFRTKSQLAQYLPRLQGISSLCAQSEDKAIAGQFVASKDPLRQIALKLNDALAVLPGTVSNGTPFRPNQANTIPPSRPTPNPQGTVPDSNPARTSPISSSAPSVSTPKRDPVLGMTPAEVLLTSWGKPIEKRSSGSSSGTTEVWLYPGNRTLYFFNGKLTNIVQ
jgi:hypothetical protein